MTTRDRPTTWWRSTVVASHQVVYGSTCWAVMTPVARPTLAGMTPAQEVEDVAEEDQP